jgi:hypothetical protein
VPLKLLSVIPMSNQKQGTPYNGSWAEQERKRRKVFKRSLFPSFEEEDRLMVTKHQQASADILGECELCHDEFPIKDLAFIGRQLLCFKCRS